MRHTYLVCYDISDDVRRSRVLKTMKGFGDHLQYSVFECQLNATDLARCGHNADTCRFRHARQSHWRSAPSRAGTRFRLCLLPSAARRLPRLAGPTGAHGL